MGVLLVLLGTSLANTSRAQMTVTVGSTTATGTSYQIPINNLWYYAYTQQVVLASEIGVPGQIIKIRFYYNTGSLALNDNWTVYLGYKTSNTFASTSDWVPFGSLTQVFTGTVTASGNWIEITLATPFIYNPGNGNLVVAVDENAPNYTYTSNMFKTNTGAGRAIHYYSDSNNPNPASPPTASGVLGVFNTMQFDLLGLAPCAGVPVGGTAVASPATVCTGNTAVINVTGGSTDTGITYQWQDSVAPGVWTNIAGATTFGYTTPAMTAERWFRRKMRCNLTNDSSYSSPVKVSIFSTVMNYLEDFESITANDQLPNCMTATSFGTLTNTYTANQASYFRINHTPGGSKFGSFRYNAGSDAFITPALNLTAGKTYLFNYWYITDGYAGWNTLEAYWGQTPTIAGLTNLIGAAPGPLNSTTYKEFVGTFTPTTTGVYYLGIVCNRTGGPWYLSIDDIGLKELLPCAGTPEAGTVNTITAPCPNQSFTLTTTGTSSPFSFSGLTYQWQDSSNIFGWQNAAGASTSITYTGTITVPTRFRLIVTCANGNGRDTSNTLLVTPASFINCYCTPTYSVGASDRGITNVTLKTMTNTTTISSPYYRDYTANQPGTIAIPIINMTTTDTVKVKHGSFGSNYAGVWIDFDHSGTFSTNEFFSNGTSTGANAVDNILITPPANALVGLTRMRIRAGDGAAVTATMPCGPTGSSYGEAEDYLVNVQYAICNGPTNAGRAQATDTAICKGYAIDLYDTTHEYRRSQISWSWQSSIDGGASWTMVPGSLNKDTLLNVVITQAIRYRLKMSCDATGDSTFSIEANIRIKAPYECYCISQSRGGNADSSDIGAVVISSVVNSTGGPHIFNPTAIRKRTDYTNIRNITLSADGTYRLGIYHTQRNGVHADARVTVFMDFDNDLTYEVNAPLNSERVYSGISTAPRYYIDTFITIPNAVIPNVPTGMRVIINNDLNPQSAANLGCGEYTSGETEDYVVMFNRIPTSVNPLSNLKHVTIYPNPSEGKFSVSAGSKVAMGKVDMTVSNVTGQAILSKNYANVDTKFAEEVDLGDIARGVYFVEIKTASGDKMVQKLVIR